MNFIECTVLQCFADKGRIVAVTPIYRNFDTDNSHETLVETIIQARQAVQADLDRVFKVSLPTIDALEKIFAYYLERHKALPGPDSDITLRPLAEAAFGRTGADVSLGGARRIAAGAPCRSATVPG